MFQSNFTKAALAITLSIIFFSMAEAYLVEVGKSPVETFVGQNVILQCSYTIEPGDSGDRPQISWYKGYTAYDFNRILVLPLNSDLSHYPTNEGRFSPTKFTATRVIDSDKTAVDLHISGVITTDSSIYSCDVDVGSKEGIIVLDVQGPSPPTFIAIGGYASASVLEGGSIKITCSSDGVPTPTCTWKHQVNVLSPPAPDPCRLELSNVQRSDAGTYTCTIANSEGSMSITVKRDVEFPPTITNRNEENEFVDEGDKAVLRCEAEGNPPPDLDWVKGSTVITGSQVYVSNPDGFNIYSTLTIDSVDPERDYRKYACNATNKHGRNYLIIKLSRTTVPEPPTNVAVYVIDTELTVTWTEGQDGGHPQTFTVEYREPGSGTEWKKVDDINRPPMTLTGLQPLTNLKYEIRVRSHNILGKSDYSTTALSTDIPVSNGSGYSSASTTPVIIGVFVTTVLLIENSKHEPVYTI